MDNYCSQKFWWFGVDIEKQESTSCCSATADRIDIDWLTNNSGQLFNTTKLKLERQLLLNDSRPPSCTACWQAEDRGIPSRRQLSNSQIKTHTNLNSTPSSLNIIIGSDCNLTCSYCCKQFSSAWSTDLVDNGEYQVSDPNRYSMTQKDKVIYKLSQKELMRSKTRNVLLDEIALLPAEKIMITGGEPFLNLDLANLVLKAVRSKSLEIWTGLGVNTHRLINELEKIKHIPNVNLVISAENIRELYEFNRYGNSYIKFINNLKIVKESGIPFRFNLTLSNITLFGLADFFNEFNAYPMTFNMCNDPTFLSINVLDNTSKLKLSKLLVTFKSIMPDIIESINTPCSQKQKQEAAVFIKEFARRRNLSLSIFPESFINWINE